MGEVKERMLRGDLSIAEDEDLAAGAGVVAMGVPARVMRPIGERDRVEIPT